MGVDEQTSEHLSVRPNPTVDKLYLEGMDDEMVSVYAVTAAGCTVKFVKN